MKTAICFLALISGSAFAANPTTWRIENKTNGHVSMTCEGVAPGLGQKLTNTIKISPNQAAAIHWSEYTNDGMGLNAAAWQCDAKADSLTGTLTFSTDWGENVLLSIEKPGGENLALTKTSKISQ